MVHVTFYHCCTFKPFLLVAIAAIATPFNVFAQDSTYEKTKGYDEVTSAMRRLDREGDKLPPKVLEVLRSEGNAIVDLENRYYKGQMPIQQSIKSAEKTSRELEQLDAELAEAIKTYNGKQVRSQQEHDSLLSRKQNLDGRWKSHKDYCDNLNARVKAENDELEVRYARFVRSANTSFRPGAGKPDFRKFIDTWKAFEVSREIAKGLAPERNRCAMVVSLTLRFSPRDNEEGLEKLEGLVGKEKNLLEQQFNKFWQQQDVSLSDMATSIPPVTQSQLARRIYIRSDQLAARIEEEWGKPLVLKGEDLKKAHELLNRKKGVIYFPSGYGMNGGERHIDLWNGVQLGSGIRTPFDKASEVRIWIIPE